MERGSSAGTLAGSAATGARSRAGGTETSAAVRIAAPKRRDRDRSSQQTASLFAEADGAGGVDGEAAASGSEEDEHASPKVIPLEAPREFKGATRFEDDITTRAEDVSVSDERVFTEMPVSEFGSALLRGMGWSPGQPIGRSKKAVIKPYVPTVRGGRMGLGGIKIVNKKESAGDEKAGKQGDANPERKSDGATAEPLRLGYRASETASGSGAVSRPDLGTDPLSVPSRDQSKKRKRKSSPSLSSSSAGRMRPGSGKSSAPTREWLQPGIRVRVASKKVGGGAHYGRKGVVQEVLRSSSGTIVCTLLMDTGARVDKVKERWLHTALPKPGGRVCVVGRRSDRGRAGVLLERDKRRQRATIQFLDDHVISTFAYDEVAELV